MERNYKKWYSKNLQKEMEVLAFGHFGMPFIAFPTSKGKFYEWEDFGMIGSLQDHIMAGKMRIFCVDSIDAQTWYSPLNDNDFKYKKQTEYENYIIKELIPYIEQHTQTPNVNIYLTGASFGAFHAISLYLRYPEIITAALGMSGLYDVSHFYSNEAEKLLNEFNPINFIRNMTKEQLMILQKKIGIYLYCGQGAYEEVSIESTKLLSEEMLKHNIPVLLDVWGEDVDHHWYWWQKQLNHFIKKLLP